MAAGTCPTGPAGSPNGTGAASALGIGHLLFHGNGVWLGWDLHPKVGPPRQPHGWERQSCGDLETSPVVALLGQRMMKLGLKCGTWVMGRAKNDPGEYGQGHQSLNHKLQLEGTFEVT